MLMAAQAMKGGLELLKPMLSEESSQSSGIVVIGTVKGDLHDIGKNLVAMMMEGAGFDVVDLGVDVSSENFLQLQQKIMLMSLPSQPCSPPRCRPWKVQSRPSRRPA